jgi:hypothetical protein
MVKLIQVKLMVQDRKIAGYLVTEDNLMKEEDGWIRRGREQWGEKPSSYTQRSD